MKKTLLLLSVLCILLTGCRTSKVIKTDIDEYVADCETVKNASLLMPDIADLGNYVDIKYTYQIRCYSQILGFYSDGLALFVKYDQETYQRQKEQALSSYTFLNAPVKRDSNTYELPLTEFTYQDYFVKVVPDESYIDFCACKSFLMLGFHDAEHIIVYLYYYDFDIDYIAEIDDDYSAEMARLIDGAFSWVEF